jgi:drug/metabolite transporter (DMT)-like permease
MNAKRQAILAVLALAAVCLIWGTTYLALRVGVTDFPPFIFSAMRQLMAGTILVAVMLTAGKVKFPDWSVVRTQAIAGFFMFTMGNGLVGWAEVHVSSGLAAIISSMVPIWIILLNMKVSNDEKPNFPIVAGLLIGLSGIIMIFGQHLNEFSNPAYQWGIGAMFVANISWAAGSVWIKRKNQESNLFMNAGLQMLFGGVFMLPFSAAFDDYSQFQFTSSIAFALIYLILIGSIVAYICFTFAIKHLPMTIASLYAYINPLVAVLLGWILLGEKFTLNIFIAMLIVVAGVYLVNRGYQLRKEWKAQLAEEK